MTHTKRLRLHREANKPLPGDVVAFVSGARLERESVSPLTLSRDVANTPDTGTVLSINKWLDMCTVMATYEGKTTFGWAHIDDIRKLS